MLQRLQAALRARLIDNARQAWRFASVWIATTGAVLIEIWNQLPPDVRTMLPGPIARVVPSLILVGVVVARLTRQKPRD